MLIIVIVILMLVATASLITTLVALIQVVTHRKAGVRWREPDRGPWELVFMPKLLTDEGNYWRRICIRSVALLLTSIAVGAIVVGIREGGG